MLTLKSLDQTLVCVTIQIKTAEQWYYFSVKEVAKFLCL